MSLKDDLKNLEEASGQARYIQPGRGNLIIKKLKYVTGGDGIGKYVAECLIQASDGPNNPEGEIASSVWRANWEGHQREMKSFLAAASREPLALGKDFVKQVTAFFGEDQPLRGRKVAFIAEEKPGKGGIPSKYPKITWNRVDQTDAETEQFRARFE